MKKFNLGKFNLSNESTFSISASAEIIVSASVSEILIEKNLSGKSDVNFTSTAKATLEVKGQVRDQVTIDFDSRSLNTTLVYGQARLSEIVIDATAIGQMLGEDFLELKGFTLNPGQEIEINLCDLTALVNGENAIHLLGAGAEFFDLSSGENEVLIEVDSGANFLVEGLWKDRWL